MKKLPISANFGQKNVRTLKFLSGTVKVGMVIKTISRCCRLGSWKYYKAAYDMSISKELSSTGQIDQWQNEKCFSKNFGNWYSKRHYFRTETNKVKEVAANRFNFGDLPNLMRLSLKGTSTLVTGEFILWWVGGLVCCHIAQRLERLVADITLEQAFHT